MLKYKQKRTLVKCVCDQCGEEYEKPKSEFDRNIRLNRHNFCSRKCSVTYSNKTVNKEYLRSKENLDKLKFANLNKKRNSDPFTYILRSVRQRYFEHNLTSEYLKQIWDNQDHKCVYTHIELIIPNYSNRSKIDIKNRASLDRIDSSKGYIEGNVQFVSTPINYMKNTMSDEKTKEFLLELSKNILSSN
jgi:hypothetical protein